MHAALRYVSPHGKITDMKLKIIRLSILLTLDSQASDIGALQGSSQNI